MCTLPEALPSTLWEHPRKCLELGREQGACSHPAASVSGEQWTKIALPVWQGAPQGNMRSLYH